MATVFSAGRKTECFLSIGTGIASNSPLSDFVMKVGDPTGSMERAKLFGMGLVSAATNTESTNVLFKVLVNQFAPTAGQEKYFRLNFEHKTAAGDNFVDLVDSMDDARPDSIASMGKATKDWISANGKLISQAGEALKRSIAATK